jgi:WD repeat-containing protein 19
MCRELERQNLAVPSEMSSSLLLLHSYTLARMWVKKAKHDIAARLLLRVTNSISKFPARKRLCFSGIGKFCLILL